MDGEPPQAPHHLRLRYRGIRARDNDDDVLAARIDEDVCDTRRLAAERNELRHIDAFGRKRSASLAAEVVVADRTAEHRSCTYARRGTRLVGRLPSVRTADVRARDRLTQVGVGA